MSDLGSVSEWASIAEAQERGADNCIPRFYMREVPNKKESEIAGRPKFDLVPYVEIITPGDKLERPDVKVSDDHKKRWPGAWSKFQLRQAEGAPEGTPIEAWPYLNRAQVAEFKALGILTVESLANLSDSGIARIGPDARAIVKRAGQFLAPQGKVENELRAENRNLSDEIKRMKVEIDHLKKVVEGKARGRPRKVREDEPCDNLHTGP